VNTGSVGLARGPGLGRLRARVQVGGEEPAEHDVFGADGGQPRQRHQHGEPAERQPADGEREQLVRLETGSSSDAEFARCVHAYTCGRGPPDAGRYRYRSRPRLAHRMSSAYPALR
jgi:hypothetical protein